VCYGVVPLYQVRLFLLVHTGATVTSADMQQVLVRYETAAGVWLLAANGQEVTSNVVRITASAVCVSLFVDPPTPAGHQHCRITRRLW
jgi:urate oxidase